VWSDVDCSECDNQFKIENNLKLHEKKVYVVPDVYSSESDKLNKKGNPLKLHEDNIHMLQGLFGP
jgi:hypothetical protein